VGDKLGAADGGFVDILALGEEDGLWLGISVLKVGGLVGDQLGLVDGYGDGLAVDGDTVGAIVGEVLGVLLGKVVTGGNVGDKVGKEDGTSLGSTVVGNVVGVEVL